MRVRLAGLWFASILAVAACTTPRPFLCHLRRSRSPRTTWCRLHGAAFVVADDVVGGAGDELIATAFVTSGGGPGYVSIFEYGGDLSTWTRTDVVTPPTESGSRTSRRSLTSTATAIRTS